MGFKVFTDGQGSYDDYSAEGDHHRFLDGQGGVLQVHRADGGRVHYSPFGGWVRIEENDPDAEEASHA
jgi:hypothetical protein